MNSRFVVMDVNPYCSMTMNGANSKPFTGNSEVSKMSKTFSSGTKRKKILIISCKIQEKEAKGLAMPSN